MLTKIMVLPAQKTGVFMEKPRNLANAGNFSKLWLFSTIGQDVFHYYYKTIKLTDAWSVKVFYFLNFKRTPVKFEKKHPRYSTGIVWMRGQVFSHVIWKDLILPGRVLNEENHRFKFVWKLPAILLSLVRIHIAL